jgi:hypothetical protein
MVGAGVGVLGLFTVLAALAGLCVLCLAVIFGLRALGMAQTSAIGVGAFVTLFVLLIVAQMFMRTRRRGPVRAPRVDRVVRQVTSSGSAELQIDEPPMPLG